MHKIYIGKVEMSIYASIYVKHMSIYVKITIYPCIHKSIYPCFHLSTSSTWSYLVGSLNIPKHKKITIQIHNGVIKV